MCYAFSRQMVKFETLAKVIQAKYGTNRAPAIADRCQNITVVPAIASHNTTTSTEAGPEASVSHRVGLEAWPMEFRTPRKHAAKL